MLSVLRRFVHIVDTIHIIHRPLTIDAIRQILRAKRHLPNIVVFFLQESIEPLPILKDCF